MTKKELEKRVLELENEISELRSQLLTLALQQRTTFITVPAVTEPVKHPQYSPTPDWAPIRPTITCSARSVS